MISAYIIVLIIGLLIGSFLNVCIYRIPKGESIVFPSSKCAHCNKRLKPRDLIPVLSWIILKGKCRYCKSGISFRYPVVEIITSIIFLLLFQKYGLTFEFFLSAYLMSIMIAVVFIDLEHLIIPNKLVMAALIGAIPILVYNFFNSYLVYLDSVWWNPIAAALSSFGILLLIALLSFLIYRNTDAFGMGDVKIYLPIGLYLGLELTFLSILLSTTIGGIFGIILLITGKADRKSVMPFGPFISLSVLICLLWGREILISMLTYLYR